MIPSTYTVLDKLPMTPNGKIDRKALQDYKVNVENKHTHITQPRNKTEEIILKVIKKKLNVEDFGIDSNIFDYGADSLIIINIITELFEYNFDLKVYDMYKHPTVREMYDHLLHNTSMQDVDVSNFNKINKMVKNFNRDTNPKITKNKINVFLTGASGFLGSHILAELLDSPEQIKTVYCAMREKNHLDVYSRLSNKMHFYFGDKYDEKIKKYVKIVTWEMTEPNLGLSEDEYKKLQKDIDIVIHCAANVKHYGNYSDFERININGTKNIIDFCIPGNIHLHYISTMTVSGNYLLKQNKDLAFDEYSFYNNQNFDKNVYSKSKLICEAKIIENINNGLNTTIYRVGDLTGRYTDGVFQENISENSIYLRLKSIAEIGYISNTILKNDLEFSPVDSAAKAIKTIIWSDINKNRIFNIYNPNMISTVKLLDAINKFNYSVKPIDKDVFSNVIMELSKDEKNQSKLLGIINDFTEDKDLIYNYTIKQNNDITCDYLKNLGFEWPIIDEAYLDRIITYMKKVNFIK
jgi:thioester reductase-like protein